jgi:hypothetical protein
MVLNQVHERSPITYESTPTYDSIPAEPHPVASRKHGAPESKARVPEGTVGVPESGQTTQGHPTQPSR